MVCLSGSLAGVDTSEWHDTTLPVNKKTRAAPPQVFGVTACHEPRRAPVLQGAPNLSNPRPPTHNNTQPPCPSAATSNPAPPSASTVRSMRPDPAPGLRHAASNCHGVRRSSPPTPRRQPSVFRSAAECPTVAAG
ncbi:MAG: hypothetical protein WDW36_008810 [Sanguina aurantia]